MIPIPKKTPYELTGHVRHLRSALWNHRRDCRLRIAIDGAAGIECEHGHDVCPKCDPCTCRCKYCGRPYPGSPASYAENPFCAACLHERTAKARERLGPVEVKREGGYVVLVPKSP